MLGALLAYALLFGVAFGSATVLPFQSEIVLIGLLASQEHSGWALVLVASVGNTLGSVVNWLLGRFIAELEGKRWFPVRREQLQRAEVWYHRYGRWSLLLSWAPIIGDPLTIVAGVLRERLDVFVALVAIAKTLRYLALVAVYNEWF